MGDNEMILGAAHRSSGIHLWLGKISARRQSDEGCAASNRLKWGPLPPNEVVTIAQRVREGYGN
jgi:hypothetical protein